VVVFVRCVSGGIGRCDVRGALKVPVGTYRYRIGRIPVGRRSKKFQGHQSPGRHQILTASRSLSLRLLF